MHNAASRIELPSHPAHDASAYGRNGAFDPRLIEVGEVVPGSCSVWVRSKNRSGNAPLTLRLPPEEALQVAEAITDTAHKIIAERG